MCVCLLLQQESRHNQNMYNRSTYVCISFIILKANSYTNDAIIDKQSIKYYGKLRRYNWSMP